jgi:hypothetical protein
MSGELHWHEAYGPCPGACDYDADALIDPDTGRPVLWRCGTCGTFPATEPEERA